MLELHNLSRSFGSLQAVKPMDMYVEKGEIRGLIGPNGSGKTTLFNLISGFLRPTSGTILFQGRKISGRQPHRVAQAGLIRTFQLTSIYGDLTVLENVVMAAECQRKSNLLAKAFHLASARRDEARIEGKARDILERFELGDVADVRSGDLPGGTQRILGIANALAGGPVLLMLDEPLAGLNTSEKPVLMDKIRSLRAEGLTILIIEHDMKAIMTTCDKITVISHGNKIAEGTPEEVSRDPKTIDSYLGEDADGHA